MRRLLVVSIAIAVLVAAGCSAGSGSRTSDLVQPTIVGSQGTAGGPVGTTPSAGTFRILAASEMKDTIEPILAPYFQAKGISYQFDGMGSVDISNKLKADNPVDIGYDAVMVDSKWIALGDIGGHVKNPTSVAKTFVGVAMKQSVAQKLGLVGRDVTLKKDLIPLIEKQQINFAAASATQANSGASFLFGLLSAISGHDPITQADLNDPAVAAEVKAFYSGITKGAASTSKLNKEFVRQYDYYDAQVTYEVLAIADNRGQVMDTDGADGRPIHLTDPIHFIYPADGLAIANNQIGYIDSGDTAKAKMFDELAAFLTAPEQQKRLQSLGWRTGLGVKVDNPDTSVFNPAWGIDTSTDFRVVTVPKAEVIHDALVAYQTALRKPSFTVIVADFSGSMAEPLPDGSDTGIGQLRKAVAGIIDPDKASSYYLQPGPGDKTAVVLFNEAVTASPVVKGNDPTDLKRLVGFTQRDPGGGTAMFSGLAKAVEIIKAETDLAAYQPAIILMTDGVSNRGMAADEFHRLWQQQGMNVPIIAIQFNPNSAGLSAEERAQATADLGALKQISRGDVITSTKDLEKAFREAKGNN